jgi:histidine triad (HIT) family protein
MAANDRCLFCRIAHGEIPATKVYEDDDVVAFNDINPQAPTHVVVIPRKHISSLDDLTDADAATVGTVLVRLAQIARDLHLEADGYRTVVNHGAAAGQTVFHVHFHLLGGRNLGWPPG